MLLTGLGVTLQYTPQLHPRPEKTGTIEPHQTGKAWANWRRGPAERAPQYHRCRGTAVRHTGFSLEMGISLRKCATKCAYTPLEHYKSLVNFYGFRAKNGHTPTV